MVFHSIIKYEINNQKAKIEIITSINNPSLISLLLYKVYILFARNDWNKGEKGKND